MTAIRGALLGLSLLVIFATAATARSLLAGPELTWGVFASWLAVLSLADILLAFTVWQRFARLSVRTQLISILWVSVSLWYWTVAPLLFFLTMNVGGNQLSWTAFAFFWEVPVIGAGIFTTMSVLMLAPVWRYMDQRGELRRPERLYRWTLLTPVVISSFLPPISILGYLIGTWQIRTFAGWPAVEQAKNIVGGATVALFLAVLLYLILDVYLGKVRERLKQDYPLPRVLWRRLNTRVVVITTVLVMGTVGLLGLIAFDAMQYILAKNAENVPLSAFVDSEVIWGFFAAVGLVLTITVALIVFVGQVLTRALRWLSAGVMEAKRSGLTIQPVRSGDELEALSTALSDTVRDLSSQRNQFSESHMRSEAILNSMGEGLVVTDHQGSVVRVNAQTERMLGRESEEIVGKNWSKVAGAAYADGRPAAAEESALEIALHSGRQVTKTTYAYKNKEGTAFPVSVTATPLLVAGEIVGAVLLFRDISREKAIEKARVEFVSLASHQLRTPLTAINWYIELLLRGGRFGEGERQDLEKMRVRGRRMVQLVNDLLNVSRLDTGRLNVNPTPTDLVDLISGVVDELMPFALQRQCQIIFHKADEQFEKVRIDRSLLRQVLHNLVVNAIKYSRTGQECRVWVQLERSVTGGYLISVQDNGLGIPYAERARVFDKFFRADNAIRQETEGTGLGLYIAKKIVAASGGKIWFESIEGRGTTFFLEIAAEGMQERVGIDLA